MLENKVIFKNVPKYFLSYHDYLIHQLVYSLVFQIADHKFILIQFHSDYIHW